MSSKLFSKLSSRDLKSQWLWSINWLGCKLPRACKILLVILGFSAASWLINLFVWTRFRFFCEPQMSKRSLYPTIGKKQHVSKDIRLMMNIISYCDGRHSVIDISEKLNKSQNEINKILLKLIKLKLVYQVNEYQN